MSEKIKDWEKEMSEAARAWRDGNDGRARACCRRAVGYLLKVKDIPASNRTSSRNAVDLIMELSENNDVPDNVRKAAVRLTTNIRDRLSPDFTFNPQLDAKLIIAYLLRADCDDQSL